MASEQFSIIYHTMKQKEYIFINIKSVVQKKKEGTKTVEKR